MHKLRFLIFLLLCSIYYVEAQTVNLVKFTKQLTDSDGLTYTLEGYKNEQGRIIVPADYDFIWPFYLDTLTIARKRIITNDYLVNYYDPVFEYQIISESGYLIHIFNPRQIPEPISDKTFRVLDTRRNKFGFTDAFGKRIIRPRYQAAGDFHQGLAPVKKSIKKNKFFEYINKNGKVQIKNDFQEAFRFSNGYAIVKIKNRFHILNNKGKTAIVEDEYENISDHSGGFFVASKRLNNETVYGLIDTGGKTVVKPEFEFIDNVLDSTAVFVKDNKVGIYDVQQLKITIPAQYDGLFRFDQLHYLFEENNMQGLMTTAGEIFIPAKYHSIDFFYNGIAAVRKFNKWGFINVNGVEIISPQYSKVLKVFEQNEALVRLPDKYLLIHKTDTILLPDYDYVSEVYGQTITYTKEGKIGFLDLHGDEITAPEFDEILVNEGDVFFGKKLKEDGSDIWSLINSKGQIIVDSKYNEISRFSEGYAPVKTNTGWGFIDLNGMAICTPKYDMVRNFSKGMAAVHIDNEWGFIGGSGMEVIPAFNHYPDFKEMEDESGFLARNDTISFLRSIFPLYGFEVIGDYDGTCFCVEDLYRENFYDAPLCMNKSGIIRRTLSCNLFVKEAEEMDMSKALNTEWEVKKITGKTLRINRNGEVIQ